MGHFLVGDRVAPFIDVLAAFGKVHGPVLTEDDVWGFREITDPANLRLDYHRTLIPPKKYLLPPVEKTLNYTSKEGYAVPGTGNEKIVLIGIHACDLAGIAYLDKAFAGNYPDEHYRTLRERILLIGLSCAPDEYCFCGKPLMQSTYDLFMDKSEDGFLITAGSPAGEEIINAAKAILQPSAVAPYLDLKYESSESIAIREGFTANEHFEGSPLWSDFANRCLSCGACSMCCPTCYCFDVREGGTLNGGAERVRTWDNCLFRSHGEIAGGTNFRRTREERFRYRHQHKYLGFGQVRGMISCVGCGRCREVCPVRIDLLELFFPKKREENRAQHSKEIHSIED